MPFARTQRLRMYYEIAGGGPNLLFIGGTGGDLRRRPNIFDSPLVGAFTVLRYDQRGLGQTDVPEGPYSITDYAEDAVALLDAVGWERCHVMGASFGGMVAQELALRYPERVERLVLACTSSGGAGGASYPLRTLENLEPEEILRRRILLHDTRRDAAWQAAHPDDLGALLKQAAAAAQVGAGEPGRAAGRGWQLEARSQHDTYDRLPALTMPVYICGGRYDGVAPVDNLRALERQIPDARLELFEGGHLFLAQDRSVYPRVMAFLHGEPAAEAPDSKTA